MAKQFAGEQCALCRARPSSPAGEHILPQWLLRMFPEEAGPYTTWIGGRVAQRRDGKPRLHSALPRIKLPMCAHCNNKKLGARFEGPARPVVRLIFDNGGNVVLDGRQAAIIGGWMLKTWLLLAHPKSVSSDPDFAFDHWEGLDEDIWSWIVADKAPPEGLSIWVNRRATTGQRPIADRETKRVPLPTVLVDEHEIKFRSKRFGIGVLEASLVYHPEWDIEHPLEADGRVLRLWPPSEQGADFASLPLIDRTEFNWLDGPRLRFRPGVYPSPLLPPLSSDFDMREVQATGLITWMTW